MQLRMQKGNGDGPPYFGRCAEESITTTADTGKRNGHLVAVGFALISSTHGLTSRPQRFTSPVCQADVRHLQ